jgi:hypothetical protein
MLGVRTVVDVRDHAWRISEVAVSRVEQVTDR